MGIDFVLTIFLGIILISTGRQASYINQLSNIFLQLLKGKPWIDVM